MNNNATLHLHNSFPRTLKTLIFISLSFKNNNLHDLPKDMLNQQSNNNSKNKKNSSPFNRIISGQEAELLSRETL